MKKIDEMPETKDAYLLLYTKIMQTTGRDTGDKQVAIINKEHPKHVSIDETVDSLIRNIHTVEEIIETHTNTTTTRTRRTTITPVDLSQLKYQVKWRAI